MAAEYSALDQIISANQPIIYTNAPVPCSEGLVFHRDGSGLFLASSRGLKPYRQGCRVVIPMALYDVHVSATVQVPTGGTVGTITLAIMVDGEVEPAAIMEATPAAAEEPFTISTSSIISVPAICGCSSVSVRNIGEDDVEVVRSVITFNAAGVKR